MNIMVTPNIVPDLFILMMEQMIGVTNLTIELVANYFGANGNANDMEVIDCTGDGFFRYFISIYYT